MITNQQEQLALGLRLLREAAENDANLAKRLTENGHSIKPQSISLWKKKGRVPVERVLACEAIFGVPRWRMRPDIYPPPGEINPTLDRVLSRDAVLLQRIRELLQEAA